MLKSERRIPLAGTKFRQDQSALHSGSHLCTAAHATQRAEARIRVDEEAEQHLDGFLHLFACFGQHDFPAGLLQQLQPQRFGELADLH